MSGFWVSHKDLCPYMNEDYEIDVYYVEIPILGQLHKGNKRNKYSCSLEDNCPYWRADKCPVFASAPLSTIV